MNHGPLSNDHRGISAIFDALMFFVIVLAASGALFLGVSNISRSAAEELSTRDIGRYVSEVAASALDCTVGPVSFTVDGTDRSLGAATVLDCVCLYLSIRSKADNFALDNLTSSVKQIYTQLVEGHHFAVQGSVENASAPFFVSDKAADAGGIGKVRWTSVVPLEVDGSRGELTLFLWR